MSDVAKFRLSGNASVINVQTGHNATLRSGLVVLSEDGHGHAIEALRVENERLERYGKNAALALRVQTENFERVSAELAALKAVPDGAEVVGYRARFLKEPGIWMTEWDRPIPEDRNPAAEYQLLYAAPVALRQPVADNQQAERESICDDELEDLASSACQMALANGVSEHAFLMLAKTVRDKCNRAALSAQTAPQGLRIVLDGPPGPEAGRFVEVENAAGRSVNAGEWRERADGLWELVLHAAQGGE